MSLAADADVFRPLTGLWTFLRRLLAADSVYCCVVTAEEQFQVREAGRPGLVGLFEIEIADKFHRTVNFKYTYHVNHQFNDLSIRGIWYYELSL